MALIRFAVNNPLVSNLLLGLVVIVGVYSWQAMPREMFPVVELAQVRITTLFPGASPAAVERQVTLPVEQAFDGQPAIERLSSLSDEGVSNVHIELRHGSDVAGFLREADAILGRVTDLPPEAERPEVARLETRFPVISLALSGAVDSGYLQGLAEQLERRLYRLPGVGRVDVTGGREWELWVELAPERLIALSVTLGEVIGALQANLRDVPGGSVAAAEGEILLRGRGIEPDPEQVGGVVLRSNAEGGQLRLAQVAEVRRRLEEPRTLGRFNGRPAITLTVSKSDDASTLAVAAEVRRLVEQLRHELPPAVQIDAFSDLSRFVQSRLDTVIASALLGLLLVLLSLCFFLNFRVALITALGIPVAFLIAITLIHQAGYTVNMISLFAFIIVLGLVVDDAIIVNENIYRHLEAGRPAKEAAAVGAREVVRPVLAATFTTIAAFLPLYVLDGTMGAFVAVIPAVVTFALLGSLWEVFGVLPGHAAAFLRPAPPRRRRIDWERWLDRYGRVLDWALVNRYFVALASCGLLLVVLLLAVTRLPFQFFGNPAIGQFFVTARAPATYGLEETAAVAARMEAALLATLDEERELNSLVTQVGAAFTGFDTLRLESNAIQLMVDLKPEAPHGFVERWISPLVNLQFRREGSRRRDTESVILALREQLPQVAGVERLRIVRPGGGPGGPDVEIGITGPELTGLHDHAERLRRHLERLPGVHDVGHDLETGKLEYHYRVNERGRQLGITQSLLSEAVRAGFQGLEVMHVDWAERRIAVRVIYPDTLRQSAEPLAHLALVLPNGRSVYLEEVADVVAVQGLGAIQRRDRQRLVTVTADIDSAVTTPLAVNRQVDAAFADFAAEYPGYALVTLGERQEALRSLGDLMWAAVIALAAIYCILAALFRSLLDPLVVMLVIPFALIGVVLGHLLFGLNLQFLSLVGFLALAGIVVNDSLLLIDFAKRRRGEGWERFEAVLDGARRRARPILLTSFTTFLGLSPLILFASGQTAFLTPMAVSLGFGLLAATGIILIVLPCFYLIFDDLRRWAVGRARVNACLPKSDASP